MKLFPLILMALVLAAPAARADSITEPFAGITLEQLYDSNVMSSRGPDTVTRVTPRVGLIMMTHRLWLGTEYRLALHAYDTGTADNTINHRAGLRAAYKVTPRLDVAGDAVFLAGDDPILLERAGVGLPQGGFIDLETHAGFKSRLTRRLDLDATYMYRLSRFEYPTAVDGDEHRVDADLGYRAMRTLTLRLIGRAQHFVSYGDVTGAPGDAYGGGAGAEYAFSERTRARASGGALAFTGGGVDWFAYGDLSRVGRRWRAALRFYHDIYGGTGGAEAVWFDSLQLDTTFRLARDLDLRVRGGGYRGGVAPMGATNVSGLVARGDLGWTFLRNMRVELYAEHRAQDATGGFAFGDVQRTVAGLRLTAVLGSDLTSQGELP